MAGAGIPITRLIEHSATLGEAASALAPAANLLERLSYDDISTTVDEDRVSLWLSLILDGQIGFELPGGFAIKIGEGDGVTPLVLGVRISSAGVAIAVEQLAVVLSIPDSLLRPAPPADGGETPQRVELVLDGALIFDEDRNLRVEGFESVSLPRSFVGSSSVVISADDVAIDTTRGLTLGAARIELPEGLPQLAPEELVLTNAVIGPSGVSGRLEAQYTPEFNAETKRFVGQGSGELGGVPFSFTSIAIELRDNNLVEGSLAGQLLLPFFDQPTAVAITLQGDGSFAVDLSGGATALATIERERLLKLSVQHIGFEVIEGSLLVRTGGTVTLLIGGEEWPTFRADDISIDPGGDISVHGVGLTLRGDKPLDLGASPAGTGRIPGVTVDKLDLSGNPLDDGLIADAELTTVTTLGPFTGTLQKVGVHARLAARLSGFGAVAGDLSFRPPTGIAIDVDSDQISGGGFLSVDREKGQYAGAVQLTIRNFLTVTAIGIITTRLPNGAKGFSLVVMITADGFKPIPLGLGFTLTAIGGLLTVNRTCNEEFLREGIKNNTLGDLLFPKDPVRNLAQIFGTLNNAFPPRIGSYLLGPVVRISWGTPPVLTMDLALVLELGQRRRLIILGRVRAIMPSEKHDLIRLQMNALGVLDFDQNSISIDAVLYDSRLAGKFPITGSMALRLRWGSAPMFALSIGGFHPAFKPPANFPVLQRLAISFSNSESFRLRAECYFAITSNTLQFGAKMELYAKAAGFSIEGQIGFDVLIQFDPFFFIADFYASVQLKRGSHNLFKVKVEGKLSGPRPLHVKGKATFEIFWCDFSVRFDKTLVSGDPPPALAPIDVLAQLVAALGDARNWSGSLPAGDRRLVTLREEVSTDDLTYHPLEALSVRQKVVPLGLEIAKFGSSTPSGPRLFTISNLSVSGKDTKFDLLLDFFAPAQFLELSDDEKLQAPSFEAMTSGISLTPAGYVFSSVEVDILEDESITYETRIIDQKSKAAGEPTRKASVFSISPELLRRSLVFGAAALSPVSRTGSARYRAAAAKNVPAKKGWTVASAEDGSPQGAPGLEAGKIVSYSESFQALQKLKQENPARAKTLMLVRISVN